MVENPSGSLCAMVFGEGTTEFLADSWASSDSLGNGSLGRIQYRVADNRLYALPELGIPLLAFEQLDANRIREVRMPDCMLTRVEPASASAGPGSAAAATRPPAATAPSAQSVRTADEACRLTLIDQLGRAGLEQGRQHVARRFTQSNDVTSKEAPGWIRIEGRRSACDDARVLVTLHDFDATGVLRTVTYLWRRQLGPSPSTIFAERLSALSRLHSLPAPQSPGRLEADVPTGRLVLQDIPEQNMLAETYSEKR